MAEALEQSSYRTYNNHGKEDPPGPYFVGRANLRSDGAQLSTSDLAKPTGGKSPLIMTDCQVVRAAITAAEHAREYGGVPTSPNDLAPLRLRRLELNG